MISQRITQVYENIARICQRLGRNPQEIKVIAVTKYTTLDAMRESIAAGVVDIGENRVQEARDKFAILDEEGLAYCKHLIGHLQTNKAKLAVELFDMIQSVDSLKIAREIDKYAGQNLKVMDILIQVNASQESQKSGVGLDDALALIEQVSELPHVRVRGFMTIGPLSEDKKDIEQCFKRMSELYDQTCQKYKNHPRVEMRYLSMGMTHDYAIAIENGANMVRIGSAIFA